MTFISCAPRHVLSQFFNNDFLSPALDVIEEKERYVLRVDLPGVKKEDIKVSLEDNILTLEAERKCEAEAQDKQFHRIERAYGRYQRSLNLGTKVDSAQISASYKDGVLELLVPKAEETKPKTVDVKVE